MAIEDIAEIWLPIQDCPGYEISNFGRVRSLDGLFWMRRGRGYWQKRKGKILKPWLSGDQTKHLTLDLGVGNPRKVHILVCNAFHGPKPSPDHEVAHGDGDSMNNRSGNLRWA